MMITFLLNCKSKPISSISSESEQFSRF